MARKGRLEAWNASHDAERVAMARWRRDMVIRMRPQMPEMLERLRLHLTGEREVTDACYRESRRWVHHSLGIEQAHETDAMLNLPHLTLVKGGRKEGVAS